MAAEENEGKGEQTKNKGVFFWFGDDGAVNAELEVVGRAGEKSAGVANLRIAVGSGSEVADGFGEQAGSIP